MTVNRRGVWAGVVEEIRGSEGRWGNISWGS